MGGCREEGGRVAAGDEADGGDAEEDACQEAQNKTCYERRGSERTKAPFKEVLAPVDEGDWRGAERVESKPCQLGGEDGQPVGEKLLLCGELLNRTRVAVCQRVCEVRG